MKSENNCDTEAGYLLGERYARVLSMRRAEETFKSIGEEIGVSAQRARQIFARAERKLREQSSTGEFKGLSERAKNCLSRAGYETRQQILKGVENGSIRPSGKTAGEIEGYGKKVHAEVCEWLGGGLSDS